VAQLEPTDRVALVTYASEAHVVLPHTLARHAERVGGALDTLSPRGGTNMEAGLELAYRVASEALSPGAVHRVILVSDGVANLGARDPEELLARIEVYKRRGIYLSVIGIGRRVRDDMLERLSNAGNGTYDFIRSSSVPEAMEDAARIFAANLPGAIEVLAEDAKIQVDFDPATVSHYRLLGYENRDIRDEDFRNDRVDAAEVGPGTTVTALYEVVRRPASAGALGKVFLRWRDTATRQVIERDYPIPAGVLAADVHLASFSLRLLAAAAECAELLRDSYYARDGSFAAVLDYLAYFAGEERARPEWQELHAFARLAYVATVQKLGREIANIHPDGGKAEK
jgi:Ca-activated chloride channel family protein